jgi:outer membrane protein OmpA-like peptidoglycan-associated protein
MKEVTMKRLQTRIMILSFLFSLLAMAGAAIAQEPDAENCKDHPLLSRMKNYYIQDCETRFDSVEFILPDSTKTLEGQRTVLRYAIQENVQRSSPLQIRRNYGNAIKTLGGQILYESDVQATFKVVKNGKEIWIRLDVWNDGNSYDVTILEIQGMDQEVTADAMYDALSKDGFMALYINFDTGKSTIKPESQPIIDQIAALMKGHADLKLNIEGHTDNVGTPASNKTLSEQRAKAVLDAVVKQGSAANRMAAVGWGQDKPVADNRTEDGRAKNRRVEIVKK